MAKPLPSPERLDELFTTDGAVLFWKTHRQAERIGKVAGTNDGQGRYKVSVDGLAYQSHRLIWAMTYRSDPGQNLLVRKDPSGGWNVENLEIASRSEATWRNGTKASGLPRGVSYTGAGNFRAQVGKERLGTFKTLDEAVYAIAKFNAWQERLALMGEAERWRWAASNEPGIEAYDLIDGVLVLRDR